MVVSCVKKMRGSTSDRISYLPSNVIEKILTCMPIKDAGRTSVLSKKWRYNWVTLPELTFDDAFYRNLRIRSTNEILLIIYQVLLLHRGPILKFELHLSDLENCSAVDQLIPFVSNSGVRDLILHMMSYEPYKLPFSLFSCVQLERLELHYCSFVPSPRFVGFSKLLSLELHAVVIDSEVFSGLISKCPLLKELKLVDPDSFSDFDQITAPNLRCLYYEGSLSYLWIKNASNLARVSIHLPYCINEVDVSKWVALFASLPSIEFFELEARRLKLIPQSDIPRKLPVDLSHLKILNLDTSLDTVNAVSSILCLIRSSPNLEKINIYDEPHPNPIKPTLEHVEEQGWLDASSKRLRQVHLRMECFRGCQLDFVKYLLATSPILEKMVIQPIYAMDREKLIFWKAVTQFKRLSPLAEVFFEFRENGFRPY